MTELRVQATPENLDTVLAFINAQLRAAGCPRSIQHKIDIAAEEIYINIAHYAYDPPPGEVIIQCDTSASCLTLVFSDHGKPYNPLLLRTPDLTASVQERAVGGLGIFLVKQLMDEVSYAFVSGQNTLTLRKFFGQSL